MPILVFARFIQGLGGGAVGPTAYVAIGRCLPQHLQPKMFAMLSTAWVVPGIIGPSIAAVVGEFASWRLVFLGLVPLLAVAGSFAYAALRRVEGPAPQAEHEAAASTFRRLPDALLAAAGAGILVAALTAQDLPIIIGGAAIGILLLVPAFRRLTPQGTLLLAIGVPAAVLLRGVMTFSFFSADAFLPLLLQTWRGTPATLTGVVFTATTIAWTAGTWYQARHIDRWGARRFVGLGFAFIIAGVLLTLPVVLPWIPPEITIVTWILPGLGMGFMYSAVTLVVLRGSLLAEQGSASSALQLSDILGTALGTGIAGAITAAGERAGGDGLGVALALVFGLSLGERRAWPARVGPDRGRSARAEPAIGCGRLAPRHRPTAPRRRGSRAPSPEVLELHVRRDASREDSRDPRLPEARHPVLRHHDASQGPRVLQGGDRPDARALPGRARSTSSWAWSRGASSSRRRWRTSSTRGSSRCASWASCRPRR